MMMQAAVFEIPQRTLDEMTRMAWLLITIEIVESKGYRVEVRGVVPADVVFQIVDRCSNVVTGLR